MCVSTKCCDFADFGDQVPDDEVSRLDEAEHARIRSLKLDGDFLCTAQRALLSIPGPLRQLHIACFAYRPRPPKELAEDPHED